MSDHYFPAEVSVLSQDALGESIQAEYFPENAGLNCRLFYRSLHDTYRVKTGGEIYFYKVYRQNVRKPEEIEAEIELLRWLESSGVDAVRPVAKKDGTYVGRFQTETGVRYGALYTSVGITEFSVGEETDEINEKLGSYVASVHNAWDSAPERLSVNRRDLDTRLFIDEPMEAIRRFTEFHDFDLDFLEEVAKKTKEKLAGFKTSRPEYGVCHGDIYGGNVRMDAGGNPILFDFDFCGNGWRAYDISLYAYSFGMSCDRNRLDKIKKREYAFLNGYNKIRPMNDEEIQSIPLFIPFRRIFNIGTLYITMLPNTWGDYAVIRNTDEDIVNLKKWLELNPVL